MSRFGRLARPYRLADAPGPIAQPVDHNAGEAAAMAAHYATPADPDLPAHDPLTAGLLRGFHKHQSAAALSSSPLPGPRPPSRPGHPNHGL